MSSSTSKYQLIALLGLAYCFCSTEAVLTGGEKAALVDILKNYPDLASVPSWDTLGDDGVYKGRSWTNSFDSLCASDGYEYYGLYCVNGHIGGISVTSFWGFPLYNDFSSASGLLYLTNYTDTQMEPSELLRVISVYVALKHVEIEMMPIPNMNTSLLETLAGVIPSPTFSWYNYPSLRELRVSFYEQQLDASFMPLCGSGLQVLKIEAPNVTDFINLVNCLPQISNASYSHLTYIQVSAPTAVLTSNSLKHLYLKIVQSPLNISISSTSLEDLEISSWTQQHFDPINTPNLKTFRMNGFNVPVSLSSFTGLESLSLECPNRLTFNWPPIPPAIRSLRFRMMNFASNMNNSLNSVPSSIESFTFQIASFTDFDPFYFPSNWTSLSSLELTLLNGQKVNGSSILGLQSLKELKIIGVTSDSPFPSLESLETLPNLRKLQVNYRSDPCELPPDFFVRMSQLVSLKIECTNLTGAIPWYGLEKLESLELTGSFTTWPVITGQASNMVRLYLTSEMLSMIPSDASFVSANMIKLREFGITAPRLQRAPYFWTNSPTISSVQLLLQLNGPLPTSLTTPRLQLLFFSSSSLCGSLPEILSPIHLRKLYLENNFLSGTIPQSWEDNLSVLADLRLQNNSLSGTIPAHLFDHNVGFRPMILLNSNDFTGPMWNISAGVPTWIGLGETGMDLCAQDPLYGNSSFTAFCPISGVPVCVDRCPSFWEFCSNPPACIEKIFSPRTPPPCSAPVVETCPLPDPGIGFVCNHGSWIVVSTTEETITLPPDAGPVVVFGNFSTNGSITFSGTGTTIEVQGCVLKLPTQIVVQLPPGTTTENVTLMAQHGKNCTTDLALIPVVIAKTRECEKTEVDSTSSSRSSLIVVLSLLDLCPPQSSHSNTKWIIIGSTLAGVVVLLAIVLAILYAKNSRFRSLVRTSKLSS